MIAHDLRSPLSTVLTAAELLADEASESGDPNVQKHALTIHRSALWMREMVENILCAHASRAGQLRLRRQRVELIETLNELQELVAPLLDQKHQGQRLMSRGRSVPVFVDGRLIRLATANLVLNASKFAPRDTNIDVLVNWQPGSVRVSVTDRGPGLPGGQKDRLFEAYVQGNDSGDASRSISEAASAWDWQLSG